MKLQKGHHDVIGTFFTACPMFYIFFVVVVVVVLHLTYYSIVAFIMFTPWIANKEEMVPLSQLPNTGC